MNLQESSEMTVEGCYFASYYYYYYYFNFLELYCVHLHEYAKLRHSLQLARLLNGHGA